MYDPTKTQNLSKTAESGVVLSRPVEMVLFAGIDGDRDSSHSIYRTWEEEKYLKKMAGTMFNIRFLLESSDLNAQCSIEI